MNAPEESPLSERWTLTPADHVLIAAKRRANQLGFAVLLLLFREHGRFPVGSSEIDRQMVCEVAQQVNVPVPGDHVLNLSGRTTERHRAEIRALFGYREATVADAEALEAWLRDQAATVGAVPDHLVARLEARCRELAIEPPSADRVERIVRAAIHAHEERLYARIRDRLTRETRARLETLLQPGSDAESGSDGDGQPGTAPALLLQLRGDPGRPNLAGVRGELAKLDLVRGIGRASKSSSPNSQSSGARGKSVRLTASGHPHLVPGEPARTPSRKSGRRSSGGSNTIPIRRPSP